MTLKISEKANHNYLAKVVQLNNIRKHENADRLQCVSIDGNNVITGLDAQNGSLYVYFPLESAINKEFLSWGNSFEDKELNQNKEVKGFFNKKGRVRAIRLRGERSEGYIVPVKSVCDWIFIATGKDFKITEENVNVEFDFIFDVQLCEKYVNRQALERRNKEGKNQKKVARETKLIDNQFRFHIDTSPLKKYAENIHPNDLISITKKLHGTSFVVSKVLCKKPLRWYEKFLKRLGVNIVDTHYDLVYSSRKVIKNSDLEKTQNHFYSYDVWGDIAKSLEENLTAGITLYGEAVGYLKTGAYIQNGYDYGCEPGKFDTYIYRITFTNPEGKVFEFSTQQVKEYCHKFGMKPVPELYYGRATDLFEIVVDDNWASNFVQKLSEVYLELDCDMCVNQVPAEGICIRREVFDIDVYKHKSFRFFEWETKQLDSDEVDIETQESEEVEAS
jgi:hypothetical protein